MGCECDLNEVGVNSNGGSDAVAERSRVDYDVILSGRPCALDTHCDNKAVQTWHANNHVCLVCLEQPQELADIDHRDGRDD